MEREKMSMKLSYIKTSWKPYRYINFYFLWQRLQVIEIFFKSRWYLSSCTPQNFIKFLVRNKNYKRKILPLLHLRSDFFPQSSTLSLSMHSLSSRIFVYILTLIFIVTIIFTSSVFFAPGLPQSIYFNSKSIRLHLHVFGMLYTLFDFS